MRRQFRAAVGALAAAARATSAASLDDLCTISALQAVLPANGTLLGIDLIPSSVTANVVTDATAGTDQGGSSSSSNTTYDYCNVTAQYTHTGRGDLVLLWYLFPSPDDFQNRYLGIGGGGYSISMGSSGLSEGLAYGAATGTTNAGFGDDFSTSADEVNLLGNGTINYDTIYMFGYRALGEATVVGKALARGFYSMANETKLYTYFSGCSDGGRESWSQIQRWGAEYDGAVTGAPAFRYSHQQVNHLTSDVVEHTLGYYPPPCELEKIVNLTIAACDPLDGRTDGVVSRTDLCKLHFDLKSTIGRPYSCAAQTSTSPGLGLRRRQASGSETSSQPAQNGTVSAKGVEVAQTIIDGLKDTKGRQAYLSYQPSAEFDDAQTQYDNATGSWTLDITSMGGEFVRRFVMLEDADNIDSLDGVTYDTMVEWMTRALVLYGDSLQTTLPDVTPFASHGGKVLHYHGESDPSIPAASSVHYYDSVRKTMYPELAAPSSYNESVAAMNDWYRFFLVPGAGHCGTNQLQPGPWPDDAVQTVIDWVEKGVAPDKLAATIATGSPLAGQSEPLCAWPLRPRWHGNGTEAQCEYDQASIDSWTYTFDAFKLPIY